MTDYKPVIVDGVERCGEGRCPYFTTSSYCCTDIDYCNKSSKRIDQDSLCEPAILARLKAAEERVERLVGVIMDTVTLHCDCNFGLDSCPSRVDGACNAGITARCTCWRAWLERGE